jgi:ACS family tartrate transporter-like MFS transporter
VRRAFADKLALLSCIDPGVLVKQDAVTADPTPIDPRATLAKVRNRILPLLIAAFVVSYVDRVNVGFAAITLSKDIGLTASMYGLGAGLVFFGYCVFELPSNLALERFGARRWLARIMITWGLIGCSMALVQGPTSFYVLRFLLGAAEAGLFPGVILYLTYWLPGQYRARYIAMFALSIPLANVIGAPVSGALLELDGMLGVKGWQWVFILEALPAVILGVLVLLFLSDKPRDARWLSEGERQWLQGEIDRETAGRTERRHLPLRMLLDARVAVFALVFFSTAIPSYGLSLWMPQIVKSLGHTNINTGFIVAIPFVFGCASLILMGRSSDRRQERVWHAISAALMAAAGMALGAASSNTALQLVGLCIAATGIYGLKGPFLTLVSEAFGSANAAAGIALVSTFGNLSGFVAPYMVGVIIERFGGYRFGLLFLAIMPFLGALVLFGWSRQRLAERNRQPQSYPTSV